MSTTTVSRLADFTSELRQSQMSRTFIRAVAAKFTGRCTFADVPAALAARYPGDRDVEHIQDAFRAAITKAAIAPGVTYDTDGAVLAALKPYGDAFLAVVRAQSILGRLRTRSVPFNVGVPVETSPSVASWAGENKVKPIGSAAFAAVVLTIAKIANIVITTKELASLITPGSEALLERDLAAGVAEYSDQQFVDPAVAAVANVHPASITNGIAAIPPSGTTAAALVKDVANLIGTFLATCPDPTNAALLLSPTYAAMLVAATNSQTLTVKGGTYAGVDVVPSAACKTTIAMVDASQILVADGGIVVDTTDEAIVQMDSAPTDPPTATTIPVSLWENNLVALRAERFVHWKRARTSAVAYVSPCAYVPGT